MGMTHIAPTAHKSSHARLKSEIETVFERSEGLDQSFLSSLTRRQGKIMRKSDYQGGKAKRLPSPGRKEYG
jgi:hypothetical protein